MQPTPPSQNPYKAPVHDIGPGGRDAGRRASDSELQTGDWILAVLCSGIGCIMGIVWLVQGEAQGREDDRNLHTVFDHVEYRSFRDRSRAAESMTAQPLRTTAADSHVASAARQRHLFFATLAIVVVGLACALNVHDDRVALAGFADYPLPHLCMSRSMFGVTCPGCGLTRSFVYLAHGDWQAAWRAHRLGWLMAAIVLFQIPYRAWMLAGRRDALPARLVQAFAVAVVALLIINWGLSLFGP